jgi:hypothetical protein
MVKQPDGRVRMERAFICITNAIGLTQFQNNHQYVGVKNVLWQGAYHKTFLVLN